MGYVKDTIKGLSWMGALHGSTKAITFVRTAILARLLGPKEFGIFGIAALVMAFLEVLTETGINAFLIQEEKNIKTYLNTAWVISILRGLLISFVLVILSKPISIFFNSPESYPILKLIALVPLIRGFINPAVVKFQKELKFNKEFILRFSIYLVDTVVAISIAFIYRSVISLVWGLAVGVLMELVVSHLLIKPTPKLQIERLKAKKIISSGKWITLSGIFNYLFQEGDDIVVGRLMETYALGLYQVAYKIATLPITSVGRVFYGVTFPVFVKIRKDKKRLLQAYLKVVVAVTVLVLPLGIAFWIFPYELVNLVLGKEWLGIVEVIRIVAIYGVIRSITATSSAVFLALKKQNYNTTIMFVSLIGMALTIIPLVNSFGILGAGVSALIGWLLAIPFIVYYLYKVFSK